MKFIEKAFLPILVLLVLLNGLILLRLGAGIALQLYSLAATALLTLSGLVLLGRLSHRFSDPLMRLICAFSTGLIAFTALNFILLHFNKLVFTRAVNALFFTGILATGIVRRKKIFPAPFRPVMNRFNIIWILFLSFILSFATSYGLCNNPSGPPKKNRIKSFAFLMKPGQRAPNWGWNKDKRLYIITWCDETARNGLPGKELQPNGVQIFFVSLARLISDWNLLGAIKLYKCFSPILLFSLLFSFGFIAKRFFNAGPVEIFLTVTAVPFFGAVNYPFFSARHSSYLGFFLGGATMFHSVTQVFCLMIGAAGIILVLLPADRRKSTFAWGCLLITGSFFFKPSLFAVAAPVIIVVFIFYRRLPNPDKIRGFALLLIPPLYWLIYPAVYNLHAHEVPIAFQPFRVLGSYAAYHFPPSVTGNVFLRNILIIAFSFAVFIPILIDALITALRDRRKKRTQIVPPTLTRLPGFFLVSLFLLGTLSYALLVQDNNLWKFCNFGWGAAAALVFFLPVLVVWMVRIKSIILRAAAGLLFCLHLWGGLFQLYIFTFRGVLF